MSQNICGRCQYTWCPRGHAISLACPRCGSPYVSIPDSDFSDFGTYLVSAIILITIFLGVFAAFYENKSNTIKQPTSSQITKQDTQIFQPSPSVLKANKEPERTANIRGNESNRLGISSGWSNTEDVSPEEQQNIEAAAKQKEKEHHEAVAKQLRETAAKRLLNIGKNYELNYMNDFAATKFKEVVWNYPDTDAARECKSRLEYFAFKNGK